MGARTLPLPALLEMLAALWLCDEHTSSRAGLAVTVGYDGNDAVALHFADRLIAAGYAEWLHVGDRRYLDGRAKLRVTAKGEARLRDVAGILGPDLGTVIARNR